MNSKFLALVLLATVSLMACPGPSDTDGGTGGGGGTSSDGGKGGGVGGGSGGGTGGGTGGGGGTIDSGTPRVDSGTPAVDSGTPGIDSGTPGIDSGTPGIDSGTPGVDAGTTVDAGTGGLPSTTAIAIASGRQHSCAIVTGGKIRCWGSSYYGQLGTGTTGSNDVVNSPVEVTGITGASAISSFADHTCALVSGGVKCWGSNEMGQLGNGALGTHSGTPVNVTGLTSGVSKVVVGFQHTCALTTGGGVKCWGHNSGELGNGDDNYMNSDVPVDVTGLSSGVVALSAGTTGTCAVTTAGAVKCWGTNEYDRLGDGTSQPSSNLPVDVVSVGGVTALATGDAHTCAATAAGVSCWGKNGSGQVGTGTKSTQVSTATAATGFSAAAKGVAAGYDFSCALTSTNGVKCWGSALGTFPEVSSATPSDVSGLTSGISAIAAGTAHMCALSTAGAVKCWGVTDGNALGDGTGNDSPTPVNVLTLP